MAEDDQSGSALRQQLETALAENRALTERNVTLEASELIRAEGYDLVKPEDLAGAKPDEIKDRAAQLQTERTEQRAEMIRSTLAAKGLEGAELESAVTDFLTPTATGPDTSGLGRARGLGTGGTPVPPVNPTTLTPQQKMEMAFEKRSARR